MAVMSKSGHSPVKINILVTFSEDRLDWYEMLVSLHPTFLSRVKHGHDCHNRRCEISRGYVDMHVGRRERRVAILNANR